MAAQVSLPALPLFTIRRPRVRKDLRKLSPWELNDLRHALERLYAITNAADDRGYEWIAGRHGYPGNFCHKDENDFWIWHRAYIYEFEERLRDAHARSKHGLLRALALPYWDWTVYDPATDAPNGIPNACSDPTYVDLRDGVTKPNPLFGAFSIATNAQTARDTTSLRAAIPGLATGVAGVLATSDFLTASSQLNLGPHGQVHVLVGGDMASIRTAAFDPIFWLHHCNIDRIWWMWQRRYGNTTVPAAQLSFVTAPFAYQGSQTLHAEGFFGYTYRRQIFFLELAVIEEAFVARLPPIVALGPDATPEAVAKLAAVPPPVPSPLRLTFPSVDGDLGAALLVFQSMAKTKDSYEVRLFLNNRTASEETPIANNPSYAGTVWLFGHGECIGDMGHCDRPLARREFDRRPPHHLTPYDLTMNVSESLKAIVREAGSPLHVSVVILDVKGRPALAPDLRFEGLSLEVIDAAEPPSVAPDFRSAARATALAP